MEFNKNINQLISEFPKEKQEIILEHLRKSEILGNPLLEEYFIREHASILQLMKHEELRKKFQLDLDEWVLGLEPKLQNVAFAFFQSVQEHVDTHAGHLVQVNARLAEALHEAVEASKAEVEASAEELTKKMKAVAETERRRIQDKLAETLDSKLDPHVDKAFKASSDKFTAKSIFRDVSVVFAALCLFALAKLFF